ncbi:MAG: Maf family nucleotide pyrophosphatase [Croceivirga sp.]
MIENPLKTKLKNYNIILASGSPRRKQFFEALGLDFEIRLKPVEENYPQGFKAEEISNYLAILKASPFEADLKKTDLLVTSDTVVWCKGESLAKASNPEEAITMLTKLSGAWHQVISSVCFTTSSFQKVLFDSTDVKFKKLSLSEIEFYIQEFKPYDKAGAYGIQEWLGAIGIEEIKGSYNNVVGLPTHLVYKMLMDIAIGKN